MLSFDLTANELNGPIPMALCVLQQLRPVRLWQLVLEGNGLSGT